MKYTHVVLILWKALSRSGYHPHLLLRLGVCTSFDGL